MIQLTKLNKQKFYLNCDLIEAMESTPDTVITLSNGKLYIVTESIDEVTRLVVDFRRSLYSSLFALQEK